MKWVKDEHRAAKLAVHRSPCTLCRYQKKKYIWCHLLSLVAVLVGFCCCYKLPAFHISHLNEFTQQQQRLLLLLLFAAAWLTASVCPAALVSCCCYCGSSSFLFFYFHFLFVSTYWSLGRWSVVNFHITHSFIRLVSNKTLIGALREFSFAVLSLV